VDPLAMNLKADDFELRQFLAIWKVDLDEGDIPPEWLATVKDIEPSTDEKLPENERNLVSADLRNALALGRQLKAKHGAVVDPIYAKLEALRDKVIAASATDLEEKWNLFEGQAKGSLAKPPKPKGVGEWFSGFVTWGQLGVGQGTPQADRAYYSKRYLGKAVHKAFPSLPKEMRYVGAFQADVPPAFQGKDANEQTLTKYKTVFVCYDLEKLEKVENDGKASVKIPDPVLVPYVKGVLGEARFAVEVLGQK
jgi:hypothetical protein